MRSLLKFAAAAMLFAALLPWNAHGAYPDRPIKLVVPFAAGGPADVYARLVATLLSKRLGASVIVENKPGATGAIGSKFVSTSPPDGYTILLSASSGHVCGPLISSPRPFDPLTDFTPLSEVVRYPALLVARKDMPVKLADFIDYARKNDGKLNYGSPGIGGCGHYMGEMLALDGGFKAVHIPFRGLAPAMTALIAGDIDFLFDNLATARSFIEAGMVRQYALTGRTPTMPTDIPTLPEAGIGPTETFVWIGMLLPPQTPASTVKTLSDAMVEVRKDPEFLRQAKQDFMEPGTGDASDFAKVIERDLAFWQSIVTKRGIHGQ
jgi:tripartite-type tricarboxylate transporter receptor subunit TctC